MRTITARNVCQALPAGVELLLREGKTQDSRAGPVLVAPWPVVTVYTNPQERVLFHPARDANPFFHLFEAFWMLAGQRSADLLNLMVRDFGDRFAEPGGEIHGAYGHRWRHALGFDQLDVVVQRLSKNPDDRQCVIQIWDAAATHQVEEDRLGVGHTIDGRPIITGQDDLRGDWRDRPCNTHVYLRVRPAYRDLDEASWDAPTGNALDLTVLCRSNDIIWGAYGANAVHFSVLQEYLSARLGVGVGRMYQFSNNYHAYTRELERIKERVSRLPPRPEGQLGLWDDRYSRDGLQAAPMFSDPGSADADIRQALQALEHGGGRVTNNAFFAHTVLPMAWAHLCWRAGERTEAREHVSQVRAPDWRTACTEWMERRK